MNKEKLIKKLNTEAPYMQYLFGFSDLQEALAAEKEFKKKTGYSLSDDNRLNGLLHEFVISKLIEFNMEEIPEISECPEFYKNEDYDEGECDEDEKYCFNNWGIFSPEDLNKFKSDCTYYPTHHILDQQYLKGKLSNSELAEFKKLLCRAIEFNDFRVEFEESNLDGFTYYISTFKAKPFLGYSSGKQASIRYNRSEVSFSEDSMKST